MCAVGTWTGTGVRLQPTIVLRRKLPHPHTNTADIFSVNLAAIVLKIKVHADEYVYSAYILT